MDSYTVGGAYASFEENVKGDIRFGMLADFVILDANPFVVDKFEIGKISVKETWVDGVLVYKA